MFRIVPQSIARSFSLYTQQWYINLYDGLRNCPKHVDFYSKNKFHKLVHLVCFIISML